VTAARIWREVKPFVGLVVIVLVYAIVHAVFTHQATDRGLLTPSGGVDTSLVVLGLATLGLRVIVLVVVPIIAVYRLVSRLLR
jgi:hypothetical protein